jgi:hypothetical protein
MGGHETAYDRLDMVQDVGGGDAAFFEEGACQRVDGGEGWVVPGHGGGGEVGGVGRHCEGGRGVVEV